MSEPIDQHWHPTMRLRWVWGSEPAPDVGENFERRVKVLQQAWRNVSAGELEWRDVEVVDG